MAERTRLAAGPTMIFSAGAAIFVRSALATACLIGFFVVLLSVASAEDARSQAHQACKADYSRFCSGLVPGGGRIRKCLNDNYSGLSPACRHVLDAIPPK